MTRRPGQPGTKKLMQTYGDVDRAKWEVRLPSNDEEIVYFRIAECEDLLRRAVLLAGGRWEEAGGFLELYAPDPAR